MNNNRIVSRASFNRKNPGNSVRIKGVRRQPVNCFRRQSDNFPGPEQVGGPLDSEFEQLRCMGWQDVGGHAFVERGRPRPQQLSFVMRERLLSGSSNSLRRWAG